MDTINSAKNIIEILAPFLPELLAPGSLSWFETSSKDKNKRELAENIWKLLKPNISSHHEVMNALKMYSSKPQDKTIYNDLVHHIAKILADNPQIQMLVTPQNSSVFSGPVNINGNVSKSTIVTGSGNTVTTSYTVSVGNVQQMIINQGGINRSAKIQDVWMDFSLSGGKYPTFFWFARGGAYSALGEQTWWEPKNASYDQLKDALMKEINEWASNGWDIVENDLENLWVIDYGYNETLISWLIRWAFPVGTILKHWRRYKGAHFHVRRFL